MILKLLRTLRCDPATQMMMKILFIFGCVLSWISADVTDPDPVQYISGGRSGTSILVYGKKIASDSKAVQLKHLTLCQCRSACFSYPHCLGFSLHVQDNGKNKCRLTKQSPWNVQYTDDDSAQFMFNVDTDHIKHSFVQNDTFYIVPNHWTTFKDSRDTCNRIPGFKLAILKTKQQVDAFMESNRIMGANVFVDLKFDNEQLQWGDGTLLSLDNAESLGMSIYSYKSNSYPYYYLNLARTFYPVYAHIQHHFLCQASLVI